MHVSSSFVLAELHPSSRQVRHDGELLWQLLLSVSVKLERQAFLRTVPFELKQLFNYFKVNLVILL